MEPPLSGMFRRMFVRQEVTSYVLQIPFLIYFVIETFRFGREVGFMLLLAGMAAAASVVGLVLKRRVTDPLRSWIASPGSVDVDTVVKRANQLPIFDAWSVTVRYTLAGVAGGGAAMAVWGASFTEAFLLAAFAILAGGLSGTVYYFTSEYEVDRLLGTVPRETLSDGVRLPIGLKIPTFVFVVVGFLTGYAVLVIEMIHEGMLEIETMGGHVFPFALSSLVYIFFGLYYFRASLIGKLDNLRDRIADISAGEGDLSRTVPLGMCDEVTEIAVELNNFIAKLRNTIVQVVQTAQAVDESARAFSSAADALAHDASGMNEQSVEAAAAVEQLSAGLAEIARSVGDVSTNVSSVASTTGGVSSAITEVAGSSQTMSVDMTSVSAAIEEMSSSLNEVAQAAARASRSTREGSEQVHRASAQMEALEASANQVSQVVALIEEIADQTNLLALNATIEAASAGEAGRGFAVVASEVKQLAKQTTEATERIATQMQQMRKDTLAALSMIREVSDHFSTVDEGSASIAAAVEQQTATVTEIASNVGRTAGAASTINEHVQGISQEIGQIAHRSGEMSSGADSISRSSADAATGATQVSSQLSSMTQLVRDAAERAQGVRAKASELTEVSQTLSSLVAQFKTA